MASWFIVLVFGLVLVHATARNIPSTTINPNENEGVNGTTETIAAMANAPSGAGGVDDQKNFITYGGVGGWGGVGGYAGVLPTLGGVAGIGGASGIGSYGGIAGATGVGGLGGGSSLGSGGSGLGGGASGKGTGGAVPLPLP